MVNCYKLEDIVIKWNKKKVNGQIYGRIFGSINIYIYIFRKSKVYFVGNYNEGKKTGKWDILMKDKRMYMLLCILLVEVVSIMNKDRNKENGQKLITISRSTNNVNILENVKLLIKENILMIENVGIGKYIIMELICNYNYLFNRGGGVYNQFGLKNGKWLDLHEDFWEYESNISKLDIVKLDFMVNMKMDIK